MPPRRTIIIGLILAIAVPAVVPAQVSPGDVNCDAAVDGLDVGAFVLSLIDPSGEYHHIGFRVTEVP